MVQNIKNWRVVDPFPGHELEEIRTVSLRLKSLISRARSHPIFETQYLTIAGVSDMVEGLEYHYSRIQDGIDEYAVTAPVALPAEMRHDVVAYLNRIGQLYAFLTSRLMLNFGFAVERDAPTFHRIIIFRHKYSAHRSLDSPRGETDHEKSIPPITFAMGSSSWIPREGVVIDQPPEGEISGDAFKSWWEAKVRGGMWDLQMQDRGELYHFCPEVDHPAACDEVYKAIQRLLLPI